MPNNYVLFPGFDVDSKELEEKKLAEAVPALERVNRLIAEKEYVFACKEGSFPFLKTRIINPLFVRYQMSPKPFYATDDCIGCKRCEKSCPVGNITMKDRKPAWGNNCTACLACYHVCPQQAVQYGKKTKGALFQPRLCLLIFYFDTAVGQVFDDGKAFYPDAFLFQYFAPVLESFFDNESHSYQFCSGLLYEVENA